mgnify:CR=1 FL=1
MIMVGPLVSFFFIWMAIGLKKFASIFAMPQGGPLQAIDPRTKLLLALTLPAVGEVVGPLYLAALLCVMLFLYAATPRAKEKYSFVLPLIAAIVIPTAWTSSISFRPTRAVGYVLLLPRSLMALGVSGFSLIGFEFGLTNGLRDSLAIASAFFIVFSSSPSDLLRALVKSKLPVEIGFILTVALTAIPRILEQVSATGEATTSRGFSLRQINLRNPRGGLRLLLTLLLGAANIVALSLMSAQQLAVSADLRGFRAERKRSYYRDIKLSPLDWVLITLLVLVWATALLIMAR